MFRHILCPTDLKERAYISLRTAVQIAHQFNARITMLNVHREFMDKHEREMLRVSVDKLKEKYRQVAIEAREEMKTVILPLSFKTCIVRLRARATAQGASNPCPAIESP